MENLNPLALIDGAFAPSEAQKILLELINTKISYHNRDNYINHIQFNNDLTFSKGSVVELMDAFDDLKIAS